MFAKDLVFSLIFLDLTSRLHAGAETGTWWAPRLAAPAGASLCCPLLSGDGRRRPLCPPSQALPLPPPPLETERSRGPCHPACPTPQKFRGAGAAGAFRLEKAAKPQEGGGGPVSQEQIPTPQGGHTTPSLPAAIPPSAQHPLGGDRRPGCGRFLTPFSAWKWKPSFRQRGRKAKSLGGPAKNAWVRAGGGLGLAGCVGRGGAGGQCSGAAASWHSYLLLNFSGCFSLITWNLCAMEAS